MVEVRWSGGAQECGAEVSLLRGVHKGQSITILAAYVTPTKELIDNGSRLRHATIIAITKVAQIAHKLFKVNFGYLITNMNS